MPSPGTRPLLPLGCVAVPIPGGWARRRSPGTRGGGHTSLARWPVHAPDTEGFAVHRTGETLHDESSILHGLEDDQ